jgi:D-tyrosyl-tRNA(Tyr) deacylase
MRIILVRVNKATVLCKEEVVSSIGRGLVIFVGIEKDDTYSIFEEMANKVVNLRVFENEEGKLAYSLKDKSYQLLCISNFTLCANTKKGRRPSFEKAMSKDKADSFFEDFILLLKAKGVQVKKGVFGEKMRIDLELDGPVNIILQSSNSNFR